MPPSAGRRARSGTTRALAAGIGLYLAVFVASTLALRPEITVETLLIRGFGTVAFTLLHVILAIGPLARLDRRFLPLLYNRRHLGVTMFVCAAAHGGLALFQFHALGDRNPLVSLLVSNTRFASVADFPFQQLGAAALAILFLMAATSHDFWLANLTAPVWKSLHMLVYVAYALLVGHVALGVLQDETRASLGGGPPRRRCARAGRPAPRGGVEGARAAIGEIAGAASDGFVEACRLGEIREKRARIVTLAGERVAIFRYDGKLSAISNVCQHQNGPLGEGRIVDGCITCPWHGYQYRPADGRSPEPFTERVPTFRLRSSTAIGSSSIRGRWRRALSSSRSSCLRKARTREVRRSSDREEFFVGYLPVPPRLARFARGVAVTTRRRLRRPRSRHRQRAASARTGRVRLRERDPDLGGRLRPWQASGWAVMPRTAFNGATR